MVGLNALNHVAKLKSLSVIMMKKLISLWDRIYLYLTIKILTFRFNVYKAFERIGDRL